MDEVVISMGDAGLSWRGAIDLEKVQAKEAGRWAAKNWYGEESTDDAAEPEKE